ncbi:MAG: transposase [Verrucomicrobia bacterium]|nr:transposase [Verrucomicrobiota bacterium]
MPRKLRMEFEGAVYHVMNRGDRREPIFRDDADRRRFLDTLGQACLKTDWQIHAFCLMDNHFHVVVETPKGNLVAGMKWLLGTYTARFNRRHRLVGHLFSGRYKALVVDAASPGYFRTVCEYVHLNPVRAKLVPLELPLRVYGWSSYPEYLKPPTQRWPWLRVDRLFGEIRLPKDSAAGRQEFERWMEKRRHQEGVDQEWTAIRRGWFFGADALREELLAQAAGRLGAQHYGAERQESSEAKAERLVREELQRLRWEEEDLAQRRKGDPGKVRIARRLRDETTMTLAWIARRLRMGVWSHVSNLLRTTARSDGKKVECQS